MDNTHCFSFASSSTLSASSNQYKITDLRDVLPPKNLTHSHQDDFISLTINREKWRPIMPTVTPFISPYTASTATLAITSLSDNDTSRLNLHPSAIHENSTAASGKINEQNHQSINEDRKIHNYNENVIRSYTYNTGEDLALSSHDTAMTKVNHPLHINPSIVLSEDRAFYQGPGTPMPNSYQNYYPHQPADNLSLTQVADIPPKKKRSRGKKNGGLKIATKKPVIQRLEIEKSKKLNPNAQKKNKNNIKIENVSSTAPIKQENSNANGRKNKKKDARLWLRAKPKLSTKAHCNVPKASSASSTVTSRSQDFSPRLSCRFIDRATSPINFPIDKVIIKSNKTRDIALSPIRFIEPQLKYSRSHSDEETKIKLSPSSQTIESSNKTKALIRLFDSQYTCEKCIAMSRQMAQPICPICCAK